MADPILPINGMLEQPAPAGSDDPQTEGSSVDTMIVGVTTPDQGAEPTAGASAGFLGSAGAIFGAAGGSPVKPVGSVDNNAEAAGATPASKPGTDAIAILGFDGFAPSGADITVAETETTASGTASSNSLTMSVGHVGGFVINVTFDSSVTSQPNAAMIEAAFNDAVGYFTSTFTSNVTDNITVHWGSSSLGSSSTSLSTGFTYAQVRSALLGLPNQSANQTQAYSTLPLLDPLPSGPTQYVMSTAEAKALGLDTFTGTDGTVSFSSTATFTFDPNNRAVPGAFDFISVAEHEISEVLGRQANVGDTTGEYEPMDLFRWSAPGVRQTSATGTPSYFSIDSGTTDLNDWNNHSGTGLNDGGDLGDWLSTSPYTPDSYNDSVQSGVENPVTALDTELVNILGYQITCYRRGTRILIEAGETPVEGLAVGDKVATLSGDMKPILWIGRRSYKGRFIAGNRAVLPIRVAAGALAEGVPARNLWISPEHALYIDGLLVPARLLINGASVVQEEAAERLDYFHIELEGHDVVFAEGAPAETYVDCDNRLMFQNGAEFARLYPEDARTAWQFCAPRLEAGAPELSEIREVLSWRAEALGRLTDDPDLHLVIDGAIVRPLAICNRVYSFTIPADGGAIWLASRSAVAAETAVASQDRRQLGVSVKQIVLREAGLRITVGHDHASLRDGFHDAENGHRWTDGMARLPGDLLRLFAGEVLLDVHLSEPGLRYPLEIAAAPATAPSPPPRRKRAARA